MIKGTPRHSTEARRGTKQQMARVKHSEGFTVAELLTVVAILAVLAAVIGVSLFGYIRNFTLTKYDNAAKSLYLAAQNSIADLQASGEWDVHNKEFTGTPDAQGNRAITPTALRTDDDGKTTSDGYTYYYVTAAFAQAHGILPQGVIDADVWNHAYIIEYCYETGAVYGVFYTEEPQSVLDAYYLRGVDGAEIRDREQRRKATNTLVGYYGGAAADALKYEVLEPPTVAVANGHILVTDPNLKPAHRSWNTYQMLTIKGANETLVLRLSAMGTLSRVDIYRKTDTGLTLVAPDVKDVCELTTDQVNGTSITADTYRISIAALTSAVEGTADQAPLGFTEGEVVDLTSKCSSNVVLCRSVYGYAQGMWGAAVADDLIFTSNIMADWQTEATIDAYVTNTGVLSDQQKGKEKGNAIEIALRNFYDEDTYSDNSLCYTVAIEKDGHATGDFTFEVRGGHNTSGNDNGNVHPENGYYFFNGLQNTQRLVLTLEEAAIRGMTDGATYMLTVTGHKVKGTAAEPSPTKKLVITINVHKSDETNYYYVIDRPGSLYAELIIATGTAVQPIVSWEGGLSIDPSSPLVGGVQDFPRITLNQKLPAQSSYSIKFLKNNPSANYAKDTTVFGGSSQGIAVY